MTYMKIRMLLSRVLIASVARRIAAIDGLLRVTQALGVIARRPLLTFHLVFFFIPASVLVRDLMMRLHASLFSVS